MATFFKLNDNSITLKLDDDITGDPVNDAVATTTITDLDGNILVNEEPLVYVESSAGLYRAIILSTVDLGSSVNVTVDAVSGDGSVYNATDKKVPVNTRSLSGE